MTLAPIRRGAFIDSSANLALVDTRDRYYPEALAIRNRIMAERWPMVLTNYIVAESHALILGRLNRSAALDFLLTVDKAVVAGYMTVVWVEREDETAARQIVDRYDDKDFSLTDAISFAVMDRLGMRTAFTFDRNFAQYGLDVLTPNA